MAVRYKWAEAPEIEVYLQEWRETKFATQQELSARIGLPAPTISRYETGEREWGKGYLEALAHAVGCRVSDLFSPPSLTPEQRLRSALLAYGVDKDDLGAAIKAVKGFVTDDAAEQPQSDRPRGQSAPANPRHESEPSR